LTLTNTYKNLKLNVSEELLDDIALKGKEFYPNEFGGFLIGYYSNNLLTLNITDIVTPKKYRNGRYLFERSIEGITNIFHQIFKTKKHYYIGEWHTHPNGTSDYSITDLNAMIEIEQNDEVIINNPVLLIISINKSQIDYSFYLYVNKKLLKYDKD